MFADSFWRSLLCCIEEHTIILSLFHSNAIACLAQTTWERGNWKLIRMLQISIVMMSHRHLQSG